jgi:hypothetical protein
MCGFSRRDTNPLLRFFKSILGSAIVESITRTEGDIIRDQLDDAIGDNLYKDNDVEYLNIISSYLEEKPFNLNRREVSIILECPDYPFAEISKKRFNKKKSRIVRAIRAKRLQISN